MKIKTFGVVDERSRRQLETCMKAGDAEFGVLCADHHPGYSQPIGGAVAYEGFVSPSGVGYDIGCIRGDARVTGADGSSTPLGATNVEHRAVCWDGTAVRPIAPNLGAVDRGRADVVRLRLVNERELVATPDHEVRTKLGWRPAGDLRPGDAVACLPYVGLRHEVPDGVVPVAEPVTSARRTVGGTRAERLAARGLWPVRWDDARLPALIRLLGYSCGDGTLSADGKRVSFRTSVSEDAAAIERDARVLGFEPRRHERTKPNGSLEIHVYVGSVALHSLLAAMGAPVRNKIWPERPLEWLLAAPGWIRALFLSAFASAEAASPRLIDRIPSLAIKQAGDNANAAAFVCRLLRSLGFEASDPAPSGESCGARQAWVVQLLGGGAAQLRFFEEVGFCLAAEKRRAAAAVASVAWRRAAAVARRDAGWEDARVSRVAGAGASEAITAIASRHGVPRGFVYHCWYDAGRGKPRSAKGWSSEPDHSGEVAWVDVESVEPAGQERVFDLATADPAGSFFAEGIVVHNCGNKAVRTDLKAADLPAVGGVERVMSEIQERISFGMGVPARERADHPVLDRIRDAPFEPQRKMLDLAANQLGTVGSGNHYVNVFTDEEDTVWVGVHFGSRGFGHKTASGFLAVAQGLPFDEGERKRLGVRVAEGEMDSPPVLLGLDSAAGQGYIEAMTLAGDYAYAGRDVVVDKVLEILGAESVHEVHNHHNFCISGDSIVATERGPRLLREVGAGDTVYSLDRELGLVPSQVVRHWRSGCEPVLTISTANRRLRCTGNHPVLTVSVGTRPHPERPRMNKGQGELTWKPAAEVAVGDLVVCAHRYYDETGTIGLDRARFVGAMFTELGLDRRSRERAVPDIVFRPSRDEKLEVPAGVTSVARSERMTNLGACTVHQCALARDGVAELDLWNLKKRANSSRSIHGRPQGLAPAKIGYLNLPAGVFVQRVRSIERSATAEDVYDLAVDHPSHSFVCDGVVVHNCWREEHFGRTLCVVRKGCTPARPGQEGFVGASMGEQSVIVEGAQAPEAEDALYSTVHGAGRVMSRTQAAGKVKRRKRYACNHRDCDRVFEIDGVSAHRGVPKKGVCPDHPDARVRKVWIEEKVRPGKVDWPAVKERLREQGIVLVGGAADEAPEVYKRLPDVLAAHGDSIRVKHTLTPLGVAMAGRDVFDPYKD